jgi:hypothetical protein
MSLPHGFRSFRNIYKTISFTGSLKYFFIRHNEKESVSFDRMHYAIIVLLKLEKQSLKKTLVILFSCLSQIRRNYLNDRK